MSKQLSKETKVSLVLGLAIIVGFGVALTQLRTSTPQNAGAADGFTRNALAPSVDELPPLFERGRPVGDPLAGVKASDERLAAERVRTPSTPQRTHKVKPNDSLTKIARQWYGPGGAKHYRLIYEANRAILPNESKLRLGQILVIPDLSEAGSFSLARRQSGLDGSVAYNGGHR